MKKFIKNNITLTALGIILFILIWFIISKIIGEEILIFPGPYETFKDLFRLLGLKSTYISIIHTLIKMIIGYMISIILALIFGVISGINKYIEKVINPTIIALKAIPTASLMFLFIVLSNFEYAPVFVVILVAFPILYDSVVSGIKNTPINVNEAMMIDGGNSLKNVFKVKIPLATNYILVGIASSFGLAFKVEIMSEVLGGATGYGIGTQIKFIQASEISMVPIFSWSIIAITILLLITLLSNLIKKKLLKVN